MLIKKFRIPENDHALLTWWESQDSPSVSLRLLINAFIQANGESADVLTSMTSGAPVGPTKRRRRRAKSIPAEKEVQAIEPQASAKPEPQPAPKPVDSPVEPVERPAQVVPKVDEQKKKPVSNPTTGEKSGQELLDSMSKEEIKNMDGLTAMRAFFE